MDPFDPAAYVHGVTSAFKRFFPPYCELQVLFTAEAGANIFSDKKSRRKSNGKDKSEGEGKSKGKSKGKGEGRGKGKSKDKVSQGLYV